jgi:predicted methyltransferase/DNA-directed RNA polymerase subunit RPC12/RpoP
VRLVDVDAAALFDDVATAVTLQEGAAGVRRVLAVLVERSPLPTRDVSRATGLPVPIVAAIQNELRQRGILTGDRPAHLTPRGRATAEPLAVARGVATAAGCATCEGRGLVVPDALRPVVAELDAVMAGAPAVDLALDQSHCTAETKVLRVLAMIRAGALPAGSLLVVGDDDLVTVAVAAVGRALGQPLVERIGVVDVATDVLGYVVATVEGLGTAVAVEAVEHDLRHPLPESLRGRFDVATTDPPYTVEGGRLFLSRALEGLRPGRGHDVFLHFGPKGPDETLAVQRTFDDMGLVVTSLTRNFNHYVGAEIIGNVSHAYHLTTSTEAHPVVEGDHPDGFYTADRHQAPREYVCAGCKAKYLVGPREKWTFVSMLKEAGCPNCGSTTFRPLQRVWDGGAARSR